MLKTDVNQKKARKRSSIDSSNDRDIGYLHQKHSNKPSSHTEDSSNRREFTKPNKSQNYEEEHKSLNDKNGFNATPCKSTNQNIIYEEEYKNRDTRMNTTNPNPSNSKASNTNSTGSFLNNPTTNKDPSNNNLINVNTNINNKTYANDVKLSTAGNANNNNPLNTNNNEIAKNTTNLNFKYDPITNQVKDVNVKVDMDAETAYKLYQDNKKYLPSTQQVISGAKTTGNFIQNSGILNEIGSANNTSSTSQPKKKVGGDPLSSFFGSAFSKSGGGSDKSAGTSSNTNNKKGMF